MDASQARVIVAVFVMDGCPACHDYLPRFQQVADPYAKAGVPIIVYDAASEDPAVQQLADRWDIQATPTTVVALRGPGLLKEEGSMGEADIKKLMDTAYRIHLHGYTY
jgi:thiol-disulfide isomerase/thioredoxin